MKKIFLFLLFVSSSILYSQDRILKSIAYTTSKDEFKTFSVWKNSEFLIILNVEKRTLTFHNSNNRVLTLLSYKEDKDYSGDDILLFNCKDNKGKYCQVKITYSKPMYLQVEYDDYQIMYQVMPTRLEK